MKVRKHPVKRFIPQCLREYGPYRIVKSLKYRGKDLLCEMIFDNKRFEKIQNLPFKYFIPGTFY